MKTTNRKLCAIADLVSEHQYQKSKWGLGYDIRYNNGGQLIKAAITMLNGKGKMPAPDFQPPCKLDRRSQLIQAAAFIVSEIDRLDYEAAEAARKQKENNDEA